LYLENISVYSSSVILSPYSGYSNPILYGGSEMIKELPGNKSISVLLSQQNSFLIPRLPITLVLPIAGGEVLVIGCSSFFSFLFIYCTLVPAEVFQCPAIGNTRPVIGYSRPKPRIDF